MKSLSEVKGMRDIPTSIVRKISGMPRTTNSRKDYLQLYVLAKEKDRMEQKLEMLEGKHDNLLNNLTFIESKMMEYQEFVNNNMNAQCIQSSTIASTPQLDASQSQVNTSEPQVNTSQPQSAFFQSQAESQNKIKLPYNGNDAKISTNHTVKEKQEGADFAKPSLFIRFDKKK